MDQGVGGSSSSGTSHCPFLRRQTTKRGYHTMEESYRSSSPDSLFVAPDEHYGNDQPTQRRRENHGLALPTRRSAHYAGDGLDFRRPIMSTGGGSDVPRGEHLRTATVIDLTEEDDSRDAVTPRGSAAIEPHEPSGSSRAPRAQRLPNFGRDIIDVESEPDLAEPDFDLAEPDVDFDDFLPAPREPRPLTNNNLHQHNQHPRFSVLRRPQRAQANLNMDDLLFVEERPRSRPQTISRGDTPAAPAPRSVTPYPTGLSDTIDLTGEDDDVVHLESRARPRANLEVPTATGGVGTRTGLNRLFGDYPAMGNRLLQRLGMGGAEAGRAQREALEEITHHRHRHVGTVDNPRPRENGDPRLRFQPPPPRPGPVFAMMDYGVVAFDMGLPGGNRPPTPKYEPPEPAAAGFTRSPGEDEVVVCCNCGDELAMGETEEKQEIWVIKKCGHAYCGVCTKNRSKGASKGKKGKAKVAVPTSGSPPFKQCVVDGCTESATSKAMIHVYLGS